MKGKRWLALFMGTMLLMTCSLAQGVTIAWMTDTQNYYGSYVSTFYEMTQWVADNKEKLDIQYVFHTGDIVGASKSDAQWSEAHKALSIMTDAGIPLIATTGNHDTGSKVSYQRYMDYVGSMQAVELNTEYGETGSRYVLFEAEGRRYIFMAIAYSNKGPSDEEAEWAVNALNKYGDRTAIILTHSYIKNGGDLTTQGRAVYDKIIKNCPSVVLVLCGHCRGVNVEKQTSPDGREITAILSNYQGVKTGHLRMLSFWEDAIYIYTYSPTLKTQDYDDPAEDRLIIRLK